jgi:hypothetical protein
VYPGQYTGIYLLDVLFVIGLPRSGTSLVHNLIHQDTQRLAPRLSDFGIDTSNLPKEFYKLNRQFSGAESLAEDNDFSGSLVDYRAWLELRGNSWVCKSPEHISRLPELLDVFPEARFLICLREASATLASIEEYRAKLGVGPEYGLVSSCTVLAEHCSRYPKKFDYTWVNSIPEFESSRTALPTSESNEINSIYRQIKGVCERVDSRDFKERYSIKEA